MRPFKIRTFKDQISNVPVFKGCEDILSYIYGPNIFMVPTIQKPEHSKSLHFCPDFKLFFSIIGFICLDFKWLGCWVSVQIQNLDHFQTNLFLTFMLTLCTMSCLYYCYLISMNVTIMFFFFFCWLAAWEQSFIGELWRLTHFSVITL